MTVTTWITEVRPGGGWTYNNPAITYNGLIDSVQGLAVKYNALGSSSSWSAQSK